MTKKAHGGCDRDSLIGQSTLHVGSTIPPEASLRPVPTSPLSSIASSHSPTMGKHGCSLDHLFVHPRPTVNPKKRKIDVAWLATEEEGTVILLSSERTRRWRRLSSQPGTTPRTSSDRRGSLAPRPAWTGRTAIPGRQTSLARVRPSCRASVCRLQSAGRRGKGRVCETRLRRAKSKGLSSLPKTLTRHAKKNLQKLFPAGDPPKREWSAVPCFSSN